MSGKALEEMRNRLNATSCYRLTGDSPADWELNACGAGFGLVEDEMELLLGDLFAQSASERQLDAWEALFRPQPSAETPEKRREMLRERFSVRPGRAAPGEFSAMLRAAGMEGAVVEQEGGLRVLLGRYLGLTPTEVRRELDLLLPAHLAWTLDETMTWTALDAWSRPFEELDAAGLTWERLDALAREQLEGEEL